MTMSFDEALDYLYSAKKFGIRPGLERVTELLRRLGNPETACPVIHIAGTNGKGSCSSVCAHVAAVMNKRVGWYTSPFLERFQERIRLIEGREGLERFEQNYEDPEIPADVFAALIEEIRPCIEGMLRDGFENPTVFEIETAAAFLWFKRQKADLVVLEVGMGGRLDSTNVVQKPLVCLITALSYDHMERLGKTLGEIAGEKAGIIKPGRPVYLYDPHDAVCDRGEADAAESVIRRRAAALQAPLHLVRMEDIAERESLDQGQRFRIQGEERWFTIRLNGDYQVENALLALRACREFADEAAIREGLVRAVWPGRLEQMRRQPDLIIDGAHNIQGCEALARELERRYAGKKLLFYCGMLADKLHDDMLRRVFSNHRYQAARVVCVCPPVERGLAAAELAVETSVASSLARLHEIGDPLAENWQDSDIFYSDDADKGLQLALRFSEESGLPLISFGSLYLIGAIRPQLRHYLAGQR